MGSSESTDKSNRTEEERQNGNSPGGSGGGGSGGVETAVAVATGVAVVAWGISRMLSAATDTEPPETDDRMKINALGTEAWCPPPQGRLKMNTDGSARGNPVQSGFGEVWCPPPQGRFRMNTDGAARGNPGPSGFGGILRDHHGNWVQGFHGFIGETDCLTAEFRGIHEGLKLLDKLGLKKSILESDSQAAVQWIRKEDSVYRGGCINVRDNWETILDCRHLILKNDITIQIISREENKCADKLANMAINDGRLYVDIIKLPDELKHIVDGKSSKSFYGNSSSFAR